MAKVSPVSIKYVIQAKFQATGTVEKPDVIGAVFGQTEGLLGDELELRELQKEGKIGRINVELKTAENKTLGEIEIPTSLDKAETTIIAAALETIERIGPSDAKITVENIEDIRGSKREYIVERAKKLLEGIKTSMPESGEMEKAVKLSARLAKLQEYGTEQLPAGDLSGEEVIVVEGRADVINLLKHGVSNVIGMNGTILPEAIQHLGEEKILTLFIDGDRGGILIAKNVIGNAAVGYVARAPDGKEVEELSGKELLICLRKKIPIKDFVKEFKLTARKYSKKEQEEEKVEKREKKLSEEDVAVFRSTLYDLIGTRGAVLLDKNLNVLKKVPLSELIPSLSYLREKVYALIIDGIATAFVIKAAEKADVQHLVARNFALHKTNINLISL